MAEGFAERMRQVAEAIATRADSCHNEEQTKQSLILPVIHALGYEIFNPDEVIMEFACDAPVLKTRNGKPESVDYAIRIAGRIAILIEAKSATENLDRHGGQLARYFMVADCRHAILTNGLEWRFFSDLDKDNLMDADPYHTVDMRHLTDDDIRFFSGFRKEGFSEDGLRRDAEKAMYASKISDYIKRNIIDNMSDEIVRVILGHVYDGVRSAAVVERFRPMIGEEFDKCVAEKYAIKSSLVRKTDEQINTAIDISADESGVPNEGDGASTSAIPDNGADNDADILIFMKTRHQGTPTSYDATATYLGDKRCRLHAGSQCAKRCDGYASQTTRRLRDEHLDEEGIVIDEFEGSLSMVGTVVRGSTCDGTRRWRLADGRQIRDILSDVNDNGESDVPETRDADMLTGGISWPLHMSYESTGRSTCFFSATATISQDGRTVVEAGSRISPVTNPSVNEYVTTMRNRKLAGLDVDEHGSYVLPHDVEFNSVSMAGSFVSGSPTNGNLVWRDEQGRRLRDLR